MLLGVANLAYHGLFIPGRVSGDRLVAVTYSEDWIRGSMLFTIISLSTLSKSARGASEPLDWNSVRFATKDTAAFF